MEKIMEKIMEKKFKKSNVFGLLWLVVVIAFLFFCGVIFGFPEITINSGSGSSGGVISVPHVSESQAREAFRLLPKEDQETLRRAAGQ